MLPFLKKHRPTLEEIEEIRTSRTEGIRRVIAVFGIIFLVLVSFLVSMLVLTPLLELYALKQEKEHVEYLLRQKRKEEEEAHNRFRWTADPEYFENLARDRANMAMENETIIRRPAEQDKDKPATPPRVQND